MRFILATAFSLVIAMSASATTCQKVSLKDINGLPVSVEGPMIGFFMPESHPIMGFTIPGGTQIVRESFVVCPNELITTVKKLFEESCISEKKRSAAATLNNVAEDVVVSRCKDMSDNLNSK